jgi:glycosyltransferase involved in cell wall biosynthesis
MAKTIPHIDVCICTYQRPVMLKHLLTELGCQETHGLFTFSVVVVDNDERQSAKDVVLDLAQTYPVQLKYDTEPRRSISHARNKTLEHAQGDFIALIDDDEFPEKDWLLNLFKTCGAPGSGVAGVLGPVRPHFDEQAPAWVRKSGLYNRPEHPTGFAMTWQECRAGNVLIRKQILHGLDPIFRPEFGSGSEDVDFFRRMMAAGHGFIWCNEAVLFEVVPPQRWKRSVLIKRALQRGRNSLLHPEGRWLNVGKALVAVPLYSLALPFLYFAGHHLFMRCLVKLCDHLGRLLGLLGINLVRERAM